MKIENGTVGVSEILFSIDKEFHKTVGIEIQKSSFLTKIYLDLIEEYRKNNINSDIDLHDIFIELLLKDGWSNGKGFNIENKTYEYIISYNDLNFLMKTRVNSFYSILNLFYGKKD